MEYATPEVMFHIDLNKSREFLDNYINDNEFDRVREFSEKFNYKMFRNPTLIILGYIIYKLSAGNDGKTTDIDPGKLHKIFTDGDVNPIIRENNISKYDLLRYSRFYLKNFRKYNA